MYVCLQDVEILRNSILTIETVFLISLEPTVSLGWQMESCITRLLTCVSPG